jgi:two-component system nitrate/nitrite response regulator NarL
MWIGLGHDIMESNSGDSGKDVEGIMGKESISALIVAEPGPLRDGLRALLRATPQISAVIQVDNTSSALGAVVEHYPALVLLDASLFDSGALSLVRMIKAEGIRSRCLVLADDVQQQQEARSVGADVALLKGFSAAKLLEMIERLLPEQEIG